ncbi:hypothetical protein TNCV_2125361, partial [Trichonephila clavipes]
LSESMLTPNIHLALVDPVLWPAILHPIGILFETPPTIIKYQVTTPSQPQYKIEDGGIILIPVPCAIQQS